MHTNLNHLVYVGGRRTAGVYRDEFDEMWNGTFGALRDRRDRKPAGYRVSGVRVKVLFAPDHAPEMEIMKQVLKATSRVDFAVFTFTDSSGIDDVMRAVASPQVQVRGVIDRGQGNQTWAATHGLTGRPNIEVHLSDNTGGLSKLHHKLMVLDDQVVIAGSFNFTLPATNLNDENIIVIGDLDETDPTVVQKQRDIALFARQEIDRIVTNHAGPAL